MKQTLPPSATTPADDLLRGGHGAFRTVEGYLLCEELGRGGAGTVYLAQQLSTGRRVALKRLSKLRFASQRDRARFESEARIASHLEHPGIVPVFDVGELEGEPYYTMPLIEGGSLEQRIADGPLEPRDAARLMLELCDAVDYAHGRGIVHRDLKPANVLFDATGHARITDFGLAKDLGVDRELTATGEIVGTPGYMAPEQVSGCSISDQGVDVYALGCILYASLTGRPPFRAASVIATLQQVVDAVPVPPRLANAAVPRELDAICMRCLEKRPDDRYPSAAQLAADLTAFLEGRPVRADQGRSHSLLRLLMQDSRYTDVMARWSGIGMVHAALVFSLFAGTGLLTLLGTSVTWIFAALWLPGGFTATVLPVVLRMRRGPMSQVERQLAQIWCLFSLAAALTVLCHLISGAALQDVVPLVMAECAFAIGCMSVVLHGSFYSLAIAYGICALAMALTPLWAVAPLGASVALMHFRLAWRARGPAAGAPAADAEAGWSARANRR